MCISTSYNLFHIIPVTRFDFQLLKKKLWCTICLFVCFCVTYQSTHWAFRSRETLQSHVTIGPLFVEKKVFSVPVYHFTAISRHCSLRSPVLFLSFFRLFTGAESCFSPLALGIPANQPFPDLQIHPTNRIDINSIIATEEPAFHILSEPTTMHLTSHDEGM